jgi:hypothetical protein
MAETRKYNILDLYNFILKDRDHLIACYESKIKMILTLPMVINSGAVVLLASLPDIVKSSLGLQMAIGFFILGTILGVFSLVLDFLPSYFAISNFDKLFLPLPRELEEGDSKYLSYISGRSVKMLQVTKVQIVNIAVGVFMSLGGIFFSSLYLMKGYWIYVTMVIVILIIYFIGVAIYISKKIK